jgi:opacity protein-like surface antigen
MKKLYLSTMIFLIAGMVSTAHSADLTGHQQYKIITYDFSDFGQDLHGTKNQSGSKFKPLMITGSAPDILQRNPFGDTSFGNNDAKNSTSGFAVSAGFKATSKISIHGSFGVAQNDWDAAADTNYSSSWEANLGVEYKLFNNLSYEVHFGYMDTGDLFKSSTYDSIESIVMVSNQLTMSF